MASPAPTRRLTVAAFTTLAACLLVAGTGAAGNSSPAPAVSSGDSATEGGTARSTDIAARKKQTVALRMLPPVAQPGTSAAGVAGARAVVIATVSPAKARRPVVLERKKGSTWVKVFRTRTDRRGTVQLVLPPQKAGTSPRYWGRPGCTASRTTTPTACGPAPRGLRTRSP
jgi:hypothetical protein